MDELEIRWIEFCRYNPSEIRYWFKKAADELSFDLEKVESEEACDRIWKRSKEIWSRAGSVMANIEHRCG